MIRSYFRRHPHNTSGCIGGLRIDQKVKKTFTLTGKEEKPEKREEKRE